MSFDSKILLETVPRLKTPIHLAAFLFAGVCLALLVNVDPNNIQALSVSGAVSLGIVALPLLLRPEMLKLMPLTQRAIFVLSTLLMLLVSVVGLGIYTFQKVSPSLAASAKFDVTLIPNSTELISNIDGTARLIGKLNFISQESSTGTGATIFNGMIVVHDEGKISSGPNSDSVELTCAQVGSCLGSLLFKRFEIHPLLVKAGTGNAELSFAVDLKSSSERLRVWWIFYQRESGEDLECRIDTRRSPPAEGIHPLASFNTRDGKQALPFCFGAQNYSILKI